MDRGGNTWFRVLRGRRGARGFSRMAIFGTLPTVRSQVTHPEHFAAAFNYVEEAGRPGTVANRQLYALEAGQTEKVDLPGKAFALLQAYLTKPRSEGRWETHVAHIDVQVVYEGRELMEITDRGGLTMSEDLSASRDLVFYHPFSPGSVLQFGPGAVGIYFPPDAHIGSVMLTSPMLVRKVVVKVPVLVT